jgi:hypothetical protein
MSDRVCEGHFRSRVGPSIVLTTSISPPFSFSLTDWFIRSSSSSSRSRTTGHPPSAPRTPGERDCALSRAR